MNEELKIIIRAVTDSAQKAINEVQQGLNGIEGSSKKAGASVDGAMSAIGKGVAIAAAAVTALTGAMAALGNKANEVNKGFSRLVSSFRNAGSSAKEATKYYKELFGVLGDHDRAIETGQSISRITTDPAALNDYKNIMAGAVSQYGDGYNSEALAENISETIAAAKVTGDLERVLVEAGISADGFNAALEQTNSLEQRELLIRSTLNGVLGNAGKAYIATNQATIQYNQAQANLNITLAQAAAYTTPLLTGLANLGSTMLTVLGPALQTISTYLTAFIQLMAEAIQWVGGFFGMFSGKSEQATADTAGYRAAMKKYLDSLQGSFKGTTAGIDGTINKMKELKKQTMGFDELNIVSSQTSASTGGGGGAAVGGGGGGAISLPVAPDPADFGIGGDGLNLDAFLGDVGEAQEKLKVIGAIVGGIGAAFGLWKIIDFVKGLFDAHSKVKELKGVFEQLSDDLDPVSREFGEMSDSMKKCKDDMAEAQGKLDGVKTVAGWFLIIVGAITAILGFADAWVNGLDWGNFAAILGGLAAVVGGLALAFGPFVAGIGLAVSGAMALVIGIKDLVTNGYSMEGVLMVLAGALAVGIGLVWAFNAALLANPITWIIVAIAALVAAFIILWNECEGFRKFWINLGDSIVKGFKATVAWLKQAGKDIASFFVGAWNGIKTAWSAVGGFFSGIWTGIKNVFSSVGTWFSNIFSKAWNGIKTAFSAVGSFFSGIWTSIKNIFGNVGSAIASAVTNTVKTAINGLLKGAIGIINGFIGAINLAIKVINAIPGVNITKLNKLNVPQLATGGILTRETLFVGGEGGKKEAVLPLEQNTGWMDMLADRIANRNGAPSKIVLKVGERELGWAAINSIDSITEQTGSLQLKLV